MLRMRFWLPVVDRAPAPGPGLVPGEQFPPAPANTIGRDFGRGIKFIFKSKYVFQIKFYIKIDV